MLLAGVATDHGDLAVGQVSGTDLDPQRHALELPVGGPPAERRVGALDELGPDAVVLEVVDELGGGLGHAVVVDGTYAYVANWELGLQVVDVADPGSPALVARAGMPYAVGVTVVGSLAYVATGTTGCQVIDVADPLHPRVIGIATTPGYATAAAVAADHLLIADGWAGLQILPAQCTATDVSAEAGPPGATSLRAFPTPAQGSVTLELSLARQGRLSASIHDVTGRRVRTLFGGEVDRGICHLVWDGRDDAGRSLPAGIYLARVETADGARSARAVLLR